MLWQHWAWGRIVTCAPKAVLQSAENFGRNSWSASFQFWRGLGVQPERDAASRALKTSMRVM
eukprot:3160777-Rhodomonas_salina.2